MGGNRVQKRKHAQLLENRCNPDSECPESMSSSSPVLPDSNKLCAKCKTIDFDKIFQSGAGKGWDFKFEASIQELATSECALCRLFASIASPDFGETSNASTASCDLEACSAYEKFVGYHPLIAWSIKDTILLRVASYNGETL
jgi:hypothetical protein